MSKNNFHLIYHGNEKWKKSIEEEEEEDFMSSFLEIVRKK